MSGINRLLFNVHHVWKLFTLLCTETGNIKSRLERLSFLFMLLHSCSTNALIDIENKNERFTSV